LSPHISPQFISRLLLTLLAPLCCLLALPRPPFSTLFPYTTLFRSHQSAHRRCRWCRGSGTVLPDQGERRRDDDRSGCGRTVPDRSEEHTSELQSRFDLVCRLLLEKQKLAPSDRGYSPKTSRTLADN